MTWQDALAVTATIVSIVVALGGALGRETVGELKRRVGVLESTDAVRSRELAALDERSKGMTASLDRIEHQMVPRVEWEQRHEATEGLLNRILDMLARERESGAHLDPIPRRK